jgi:hypothetical protein
MEKQGSYKNEEQQQQKEQVPIPVVMGASTRTSKKGINGYGPLAC